MVTRVGRRCGGSEWKTKPHLLPPGTEAAVRAADVEHGVVQARGAHAVAEEIARVSAAMLLLASDSRRALVRARLRQERGAAAAMVRRRGLPPSTRTQRRHGVVTMRGR
jgi:hypothetical protein